MLLSALGAELTSSDKQDDQYGVFLNEMDQLSSVFDPYDLCPYNGPDPPIKEASNIVTIFCRFIHEEGDFDIMQMAYDMIRPGFTVLFNGSRRSGKTRLIKNICQRMRPWFPEVIVFTRTKASAEYFSFIPICRVIEGFDPDLFLDIVKIQRQKKKKMSRGELVDVNMNILIILDDCLADNLTYSKELDSAFFEGRHLDITLFVSIQDIKGCAPRATTNCDFAFLFPFGDERAFEAVKDKYCNFISKKQLKGLLDHPQIVKKYHVLGIDRAHKYNPVDRRISLGSVDKNSELPFLMGEKKMWNNSRRQIRDLGMHNWLEREDWGILKPSQYAQYQNEQFKKFRRQQNHEHTREFLKHSNLSDNVYRAPGSGNYTRDRREKKIPINTNNTTTTDNTKIHEL
jgi:hypothetical protein